MHCTCDILQVTVPWLSHVVHLTEQLQGTFSSIFMQQTTKPTVPKLFPYILAHRVNYLILILKEYLIRKP